MHLISFSKAVKLMQYSLLFYHYFLKDGIAYAGNSIQRDSAPTAQRPPVQYDTLSCYLSYNNERDYMFMTPSGPVQASFAKTSRSKVGKNKSLTPSTSSSRSK